MSAHPLHRAWVEHQARLPEPINPHARYLGDRVQTTQAGVKIGDGLSPKPRASIAEAISGPHRRKRSIAGRVLAIFGSMVAWFVAVGFFAALLLLSGCVSDAEVSQAVAADARAAIDDARVEAWVRKAAEANPHLSEHDLSRVRAAAIYMEAVRP